MLSMSRLLLLAPFLLSVPLPVHAQPAASAETLIKSQLERVENTEAMLSHVRIPGGVLLPRHWHPGEEFAFVIEGSVILMIEGSDDRQMVAGDAIMIPAKRIHSARAGSDGVVLAVFRVHEIGQQERVVVEDP